MIWKTGGEESIETVALIFRLNKATDSNLRPLLQTAPAFCCAEMVAHVTVNVFCLLPLHLCILYPLFLFLLWTRSVVGLLFVVDI